MQYAPRQKTKQSAKERILFSLLCASPIAEENNLFLSKNWKTLTYTQLLWRLPEFAPVSIRATVALLRNEGMVTTFSREGKTFIRITVLGKEYILSRYPASRGRTGKWDETWRFVIFCGVQRCGNEGAIIQYRDLRSLLAKYGFAQIERGVYLSPHAFPEAFRSQLIKQKAMKFVSAFEAKRFLFGDERQLLSQAWNLDFLSKQYAKLSSKGKRLLTLFKNEKELNNTIKTNFITYLCELDALLMVDPALPSQLTNGSYEGDEVLSQFCEISSVIANIDSI